jgi:hypothetical protein
MLKTYEHIGPQYFKNIWDARNDYIDLILDRSLDAQHRFFLKYATEKAWTDRSTALILLEMQRNALLMYTSCGWFFDEISGIETTQIMQYAARAMELHTCAGGPDLQEPFLSLLEKAPSNIPSFQNGAEVYRQCVKPQMVGLDKIALEFALAQLADPTANPKQIYCYDVLRCEADLLRSPDGDRQLYCGNLTLKSRITLQEGFFSFIVWHDANAHFYATACGEDKKAALAELKELFSAQRYEACRRFVQTHFPTPHTLASFFADIRKRSTGQIIRRMENDIDKQFSAIFENKYGIVRQLQLTGNHIPVPFLHVADFVLSTDLITELRSAEIDVNRIEEILEEAKTLGVAIIKEPVCQAATEKLNLLAFAFARNPLDSDAAKRLVEFLHYTETFGLRPDHVKAQQFAFFGLKTLGEHAARQDILRALARKLKIVL